ncbi:aryl-sulfate sulfotransferase [Portibacter lacus]|uniref:Secretion system C-terminal sorting domain-containing protein n=1 Tax=Portibacter lacus TaxID=1099794 RepID=A0AA37SP05_9BACT|nr:aryl-sulfate sulfotransferase [Portibacter lacus]GLR15410.1 hypothetical protein GCM10007940_00250 [Portibacter lacus]
MKRKALILIIICFNFSLFAQEQTVGLLSYKENQIFDGYTLFFPRAQSSVYLINNCGEVVHSWEDNDIYIPNNSVYLLENGNLVKCKKRPLGDSIGKGGGGVFVEILSWDNELLWSYELNTEQERLHHDVSIMPNGNILMISWEKKTKEEAIENGRDPESMGYGELHPDYIFEISPESNEVVWEWHAWDHLIQDFDSTKLNYGNVANHPELIDLNYIENQGANDWDWLHVNSIDYNADLDQIILSVPYFNELWIIDHSTSAEEAASHSGGNSGMGGDLLYRVGNPQAYRRGDSSDQTLFFPHDAHWINEFVDTGDSISTEILAFNNQVPAGYSKMEKFETPWNSITQSYDLVDSIYEPRQFANSITHPDTFSFYSSGQSSVQLLPNENILTCSGTHGYIVELSPENEIVWEYEIPFKAGNRVDQGTILEARENVIFRAFKYPADYVGFENRDLSPKGFIELNPNEDYCERLVNVEHVEVIEFKVFPNPTANVITVEWSGRSEAAIKVFDIYGRLLVSKAGKGNSEKLDLSGFNQGIYVVNVNNESSVMLSLN